MTRGRVKAWGLAAALIAAGSTVSHAQHVSPMVYDLAPAGREAGREVEFWNSQAHRTAVEVTVSRRSYDQAGRARDLPAPGEFQIIPSQFMIASGARQKVRIRYIGSSALATSASYAITFRQLPISGPGGDSRLRMLVEFTSIANVVPQGAAADIAITKAIGEGDSALVTFVNEGTSYGRLDRHPLRVSDGRKSVEYPVQALRDEHDLRWILPNEQRTVRLPLSVVLEGSISAKFVTQAAD